MVRAVLFTAVAALSIAFVTRFAAADEPATTTKDTVVLFCAKKLPVGAQSSAVLAEAARKLLESSEYNSRSPSWHFPTSELQEEYQRAVAGDHLRVVFSPAERIASRSGTLRVREIIVRLSSEARDHPFPDHFVDSVFTVDDQGQVVGYALYSGTKTVQLLGAVTQVTADANICRVPADLPDVPEANTR